MLILAVDTNTPAASIALLEDTRLLAEANLDAGLTHSEKLLPAVDFLLRSMGIEIRDLEGMALAVGPGSFTGIRIGMSTVKALAHATGCRIAPVSTLEALACKLNSSSDRLICPLMDAKKGEVYGALYEQRKSKREVLVPQNLYAPDALFSRFPAERVISFIGSGVSPFKSDILERFRAQARFSSRSLFTAREIGILGFEILKDNRGLEFRDVRPLYFRKSQAEENHP